jgi:hypothetical protein
MYSTYKGRRWTISGAVVAWKKFELWWFQWILSLFLRKGKKIQPTLNIMIRVVIPGVRRPFGGRTGRAGGRPCPLCLIWTGWGTIDREITVPNLLYCSNFSYYCPPTWSCRGWQSRWLPTEVRRCSFDPSNLPWAVNQCPFDPYRVGTKVYWAYRAGRRAGGQPASQTTRIMILEMTMN